VEDQSALARALTVLGFIEMFADPVASRATLEKGRDVARACGDDWAFVTSSLNLAHSHLLAREFDAGERLLDELQPLSERLGDLEAQAWLWIGRCDRPFAAADGAHLSDCAGRAREFARAAGDLSTEALADGFLAMLDDATGNPQAALDRLRATRDRAVAAGAGLALAWTLGWLAHAEAEAGDIPAAREALEQVVWGGVHRGRSHALASVNLAILLHITGEPAAAEQLAREALTFGERMGNPLVIAPAKEILGRLAADRAEWSLAETLLQDALAVMIDNDLLLDVPKTLDALAEVAAGVDESENAARILGTSDRLLAERDLVRWAPNEPGIAQLKDELRRRLGGDAYEHAYEQGRSLSLQEAVTWIRGARGRRKRPPGGWESLTPTELRVVALVAEGLTNPQIGQRMFISRSTVKVHLSHIFGKLDITSRSELAAQATRRGVST
jgi:DNA-binding CsgD family transcriptional regulator